MKNLRFLFLLLLAGSITFVSCKKDDDGDDTPVEKDIRLAKFISQDGSYIKILYNDDNNVIKMANKKKNGDDMNLYSEFEYTGSDMTTWTRYSNNVAIFKIELTYNAGLPVEGNYKEAGASGLVDKYKLTYAYDGDKIKTIDYVSKISGVSITVLRKNFTYSGSNIGGVETFTTNGTSLVSSGTEAFTYDDKKNSMHGVGIDFVLADPMVMSTNNQKSNTKLDAAGATVNAQSFVRTYEYNDKDFPTKTTATSLDNQTIVVTTFEYEDKN